MSNGKVANCRSRYLKTGLLQAKEAGPELEAETASRWHECAEICPRPTTPDVGAGFNLGYNSVIVQTP